MARLPVRDDEPPDWLSSVLAQLSIALREARRLGAGLDHDAWLVNGEFVLRRSVDDDPERRAGSVRREGDVLRIVGAVSPVPVPVPRFVAEDEGVVATCYLPGVPLLDHPSPDIPAVAAALGGLLAAIHRLPVAELEPIVGRDDDPLATWLEEAQATWPGVADHVPMAHHSAIEAFLAAPPPPEPETLAFCHNDLGAEHILLDEEGRAVTGVIDWSDAAITDPARDLALVLRDLGPVAFDMMLERHQTSTQPGLRDRARFYARCKLLEDLAYGVDHADRRYVDAALAHLGHVFTSHTA